MIQKSILKLISSFAFILTCSLSVNAQDKENKDQPIKLKEYVFNALTFSCQSASMRALTVGEYSVRITPDSVIVDLPYYGQYYAGTQTANSIRFASARFDRTETEKKKGKLFMTIRPKDTREVQQLFFTIFSDATAILQVNSTNREPMSFNGHITGK